MNGIGEQHKEPPTMNQINGVDMIYWLSSNKMTMALRVNERYVVVSAPPIARKFVGQPIKNAIHWMKKQEGFRMEFIDDERN